MSLTLKVGLIVGLVLDSWDSFLTHYAVDIINIRFILEFKWKIDSKIIILVHNFKIIPFLHNTLIKKELIF